jgi:CRISPR-associated protein Cas1
MEGPVSGNSCCVRRNTKPLATPAATLEHARACVAGKLKNSRVNLQRGAREAADAEEATQLTRSADNLAASLRAAAVATTLDELRGVEGEAARGYFAALNLIVKPQMRESFALGGRTRRPPLDRFNALISFLYAMLMNDCRSASTRNLASCTPFAPAAPRWRWICRKNSVPSWSIASRSR